MKKVFLLFMLIFFAVGLYAADSYLIGHITTCSGLINSYPIDSKNWFYRGTDKAIQYWAYILFPSSGGKDVNLRNRDFLFINPYILYSKGGGNSDTDSYVFEDRWIDPAGDVICERVATWDKTNSNERVEVDGKQFSPYVCANYIEIDNILTENGQKKTPEKQGLYHVNLFINGKLSAITFFEMKN